MDCDPNKRALALRERGLDKFRAPEVWRDSNLTFLDSRRDYGEPRMISVGFLDGSKVVIARTPRQDVRRVIGIRKANEREQGIRGPLLG
jgi:uncharacterized DUF497 family protein